MTKGYLSTRLLGKPIIIRSLDIERDTEGRMQVEPYVHMIAAALRRTLHRQRDKGSCKAKASLSVPNRL